MEKMELIKENARLTLSIISVYEQIPDCREYKDLKRVLKEIITRENGDREREELFDKFVKECWDNVDEDEILS